jgi:hypothetical protein
VPNGPLLVYLDLNHWIGLAKATVGHRDGQRYTAALAVCLAARRSGRVLFPLSGTQYMDVDVAKIADPRVRRSWPGELRFERFVLAGPSDEEAGLLAV